MATSSAFRGTWQCNTSESDVEQKYDLVRESDGQTTDIARESEPEQETAFTSDAWQYDRGVLERNRYMLENSLATDITFIVGDDTDGDHVEKIYAHKYMLISGSPVFWSMFVGDIREQGDINIPDINPQAFKEMLRYIYYEGPEINGDIVMQLLYTAKKYLLPGLAHICTEFIHKNLNAENAAMILEQGLLFEENELIAKCREIIHENTQEVMKSDYFLQISRETLTRILKEDETSASEVELFQGCLDWAEAKIKSKDSRSSKPSGGDLRDELGQALYEIRFTEMSLEEFANIAVPKAVLTNEEELLCFRYLTQTDNPTINLPFCTKPRAESFPYIVLDSETSLANDYLSKDLYFNPPTSYKDMFFSAPTMATELIIHNISNKDATIVGFKTFVKPSEISCIEQREDLFGKSSVQVSVFTDQVNARRDEKFRKTGNIFIQEVCIEPNERKLITMLFLQGLDKTQINNCTFSDRETGYDFSVYSKDHTIPIKQILLKKAF